MRFVLIKSPKIRFEIAAKITGYYPVLKSQKKSDRVKWLLLSCHLDHHAPNASPVISNYPAKSRGISPDTLPTRP